MEYQPRYAAYLKTTDTPHNWEFLEFIAEMKKAYGEKTGAAKSIFGDFPLDSHDAFTAFIEAEVAIRITTEEQPKEAING